MAINPVNSLSVLPGSSGGCRFDSCAPLFFDAMKSRLKATRRFGDVPKGKGEDKTEGLERLLGWV